MKSTIEKYSILSRKVDYRSNINGFKYLVDTTPKLLILLCFIVFYSMIPLYEDINY